jgi:acyl-CoA dehydrogenase
VDFEIPRDLTELDEFIEREIRLLERQDDNARFFDHRREDARTDWNRGGRPTPTGRRCCARRSAAQTPPGTTAMRNEC